MSLLEGTPEEVPREKVRLELGEGQGEERGSVCAREGFSSPREASLQAHVASVTSTEEAQ